MAAQVVGKLFFCFIGHGFTRITRAIDFDTSFHADAERLPFHAHGDRRHEGKLLLLVTPANSATPGNYLVSVQAVSQGNGALGDGAAANAQLLNRGVEVTVTPATVTLNPTQNSISGRSWG